MRAILAIILGVPGPAVAAAPPVDFDRDVKPILTAHCYKCHGPEKQKGGLRLDNEASAREGGNSGKAFLPGRGTESKLVRAVSGLDPDGRMPPDGNKSLTNEQIETLRTWVDGGAKWGTAGEGAVVPVKLSHWSFRPIVRPAVPSVPGSAGSVRNPIDAFILFRLSKEGVRPSPEASRATLIRRVSFDLTGLPPTPEEVSAFSLDTSPNAYEKVVDRLLASPHFGERWGRHWLDGARYADSDGYEKDTGRPFAWRYRDWVIAALNRDLPFDRFTVDQLAGDLLPGATIDQKIATGFHRNTLTNKEGGVDAEEFRVAAVMDRVNTTGKVWLGLTVGCAQCHDHKYDPFTQREYYRLFAFFNSDRELDLSAPLAGETEKLAERTRAFEEKKANLTAAVAEAKEKQLPAAEIKKRETALANHAKVAPAVSKAMTLAAGPTRPTYVMVRGDFLRPGAAVAAGMPAVLPGPTTPPKSRLDLANWLVARDNPLTPRVTVNWVWAKLFGRGIVATPEDFGSQGQKPSHPDLLDWLADEFRSSWSMKRLIRTVVTSNTYRRSSDARPDLADKDPLNVLLARQNRLRLEAEIVRDNALAVSGLLTRTVGGPSIHPPQPAGISELTYANSAKWVESKGADRYKRGMYVWFQRTSPYPMLTTFDGPDSTVCTVRRERSNTALQALTLLNDVVFVEAARALARRGIEGRGGDSPGVMFRLALGREMSKAEESRMRKHFDDLKKLAESDPKAAAELAGTYPPVGIPVSEVAAWVGVARTLMNLDEFVTRE